MTEKCGSCGKNMDLETAYLINSKLCDDCSFEEWKAWCEARQTKK